MTNAFYSVRRSLPEGTLAVGSSLIIAGVATFAFFSVGEWAVGGKANFAPLASLWFALFALAPGFFLPLEQELSRAISERREARVGSAPVVRHVAQIGTAITLGVLALLALTGPIVVREYFDGSWIMLVALGVAFAAYAPALVARGITAGMGRFQAYSVVISSDGVVRVVVCLLLAALTIHAIPAYAFVIALAPLVPFAAVALRGKLHTEPGPPSTLGEVGKNLRWLLIGSVCSAALINSGPILTNLLSGPADQELVTIFGQGLLIARVPLFLFQAVQAALLPRLARLAAAGKFEEFRQGFKSLMMIVALVGVTGAVGGYIVGPWVVDLVYGAALSSRTLALLALSSSIIMGAIATSQALIALNAHRFVAAGWVASIVVLGVATWVGVDELFLRIEIALLAAGITALVSFLLVLQKELSTATAKGAVTAEANATWHAIGDDGMTSG